MNTDKQGLMITIDDYEIKKDRKYMKTHEWVKQYDDGTWLMGISDYAQKMLHEISYVQFEEVGEEFAKGDVIVVVEALKASGDVYAPFACLIVENNEPLEDDPEVIITSPYDEGYLVRIKPLDEDRSSLISPEEYEQIVRKEIDDA